MNIKHYPKTNHLFSSKENNEIYGFEKDFIYLKNKNIIVEEKVDGQAIGIFFKDETLYLIFRGQYYCPEKGINIPKELKNCFNYFKTKEELYYEILEEKKIIYGEWLEYTHTIKYNNLPSLFLEYDIYDLEKDFFYSTKKRKELLASYSEEINSVKICLEQKVFNFKEFKEMSKNYNSSNYGSKEFEGFYIKVEDENKVLERFKWIKNNFFTQVISSEHWKKKELKKKLDLF